MMYGETPPRNVLRCISEREIEMFFYTFNAMLL
jgi:hypothetical protein